MGCGASAKVHPSSGANAKTAEVEAFGVVPDGKAGSGGSSPAADLKAVLDKEEKAQAAAEANGEKRVGESNGETKTMPGEEPAAAVPGPAPTPQFRFSLAAVPAVSAYQASEWQDTGGEAQIEKETELVEQNCEKIEQEMVRRRSVQANDGTKGLSTTMGTSLSSVEVKAKTHNPEEWPAVGEESSDEEDEAEEGAGEASAVQQEP